MIERRPDTSAGARLWSLPEALGHLREFVSELAGFNGRSATLTIDAPPLLVPPLLIASAVPALVQLLRNAVIHGIEPPVARLVGGKPLAGRLTLKVHAADDAIVFTVTDDGRGMEAGPLSLPAGGGLAETGRRIAREGGRMAMISTGARGTAFSLALPAAMASPVARDTRRGASTGPGTGQGPGR